MAARRGARTCGRFQDQFVNSEARSTGLGDSGAGALSETQSGHLESGNFQKSHVICHSSDHHSSAALFISKVLNQLAQGHGRSHRSGGDESSKDSLSEAGVGSPGEELEELCKKTDLLAWECECRNVGHLLSRAGADKDSCFSNPACSSSKFCLFYTSQCPKNIARSVRHNCIASKAARQAGSAVFDVHRRNASPAAN